MSANHSPMRPHPAVIGERGERVFSGTADMIEPARRIH
jgi:hypothetical protein